MAHQEGTKYVRLLIKSLHIWETVQPRPIITTYRK